jgi:ubiquinone/menaquinone biosynthesis C-methylase UbiE
LGSSIRRYLIDEFHFYHVPTISAGSLVLDLGGNRVGKRGLFDIEKYNFEVVYANLSRAKKPDVQSDASCLPFREAAFDAVICSELLEHVPYPPDVLREICRVLRKNGTLLICAPFLVKIHGDPYDYARYTDYYWSETLKAAGFSELLIEKQGSFWCVLMDMLREIILRKTTGSGLLSKSWPKKFLERMISLAKAKAIAWDDPSHNSNKNQYSGFTTGFGIKAIRG